MMSDPDDFEFEDDEWDDDEYELVTDIDERKAILDYKSPIPTSSGVEILPSQERELARKNKPKREMHENSLANIRGKQFKPGNQLARKPRRKSFKKVTEEIWELALTPDALDDNNKKLKDYIQQRVLRAKRDGQNYITLKQAMIFAQMYKAVNGDTQAFNALLDRVDGKPVQMNLNANKDFSYVDFINGINGVEEDED